MPDYNRVLLAGRLTRDPELRYTPSGTAVADLSLAVSETYRNKAGESVEQTCFVDIVVWARQAETSAQYLFKGSPALIEGRLQLDKWQNKDGETRSKLRVRADRVQFLGSPGSRAGYDDTPGGPVADSGGDSSPPDRAPAADTPDDQPPGPDEGNPFLDDENLPF